MNHILDNNDLISDLIEWMGDLINPLNKNKIRKSVIRVDHGKTFYLQISMNLIT